MITVIDYGAGNLRSVENALRFIGAEPRTTSEPGEIDKADKVIFPGVGAFGDVMLNLERQGLDRAIKDFIALGKPFLGICLGMQNLFEKSEESPGAKGLGILKGRVIKFSGSLKIPQIGWNQLNIVKGEGLFRGIKNNAFLYFVHSYYAVPQDKGIVSGETEYGQKFASAVEKENIYAVQFHPEKSGEIGLRMLKNFKEL